MGAASGAIQALSRRSAAACPAAALLRAPSAAQPPQDGRLPIYKLGKLQPDDKEMLRFGMVRGGLGTAPQPVLIGEPSSFAACLLRALNHHYARACLGKAGYDDGFLFRPLRIDQLARLLATSAADADCCHSVPGL